MSSGGSQQQLEATIAETIVPTLAISSPRPESGFAEPEDSSLTAAPGDCGCFELQQSGFGTSPGTDSSDMAVTLIETCGGWRPL
jgi:hypothetical protein